MQNQEDQEIEIDLREIAGLLFSRMWLLIISGVLIAVIAGAATKLTYVPTYTSTAQLYIIGNTGGVASALADLSSLQIGSQLTQDYMVLLESRPVLEQVAENLDLDMTYEEMIGSNMITIENPDNTRILQISVTTEDPDLSKRIVNNLIRVGKKRIADVMQAQEPNIADDGVTGYLSEGSHFARNTALGFIVGAFIAAFIIIVMYLMDDTIKSSEDLEKYLGLNTLGTIPLAEEHSSSKSKKKGRKKSGKKTR
jgi:capsular polysaccharide biosynthesis protein